jgi:chromosome segregation ATPase
MKTSSFALALVFLPAFAFAAKPAAPPAPVPVDYHQPADVQAVRQKIAQEKDSGKLRSLATEQVNAAESLAAEGKALADQVQELKAGQDAATTERNALTAQNQQLETDLQQLRAALDEAQLAHDRAEKQIAELKRKAKGREEEKQQLISGAAEARADTQQLTMQNAALSGALLKTQSDLAAQQKEKTEAKAAIDVLTHDKAALQAKITAAAATLAETESRARMFTFGLIALFVTNAVTAFVLMAGRKTPGAGAAKV